MQSKRFENNYRGPFKNYDSSYTNRSNISAHSEHLRKLLEEEGEVYPAGFSQLLRGEERNIRSFKSMINKEKERVNEDMHAFKTEINHTLQDMRLSLHAHLDRIYQDYMERYAKFKGELFEINRLKSQIECEYPAHAFKRREDPHATSNSNIHTISQMEKSANDMKKVHVMNYLAELQKDRILPLHDLQREIVLLTEYSNGFYQSEDFRHILNELKAYVHQEVRKIYTDSHLYIREVSSILFKEEPRILDGIDERMGDSPGTRKHKNPIFNDRTNAGNVSRSRASLEGGRESKLHNKTGSPVYGELSQAQQAVRLEWAENLHIVESNRFSLDKSFTPLCAISINNQLVFGLKDGSIAVTTPEGQLIKCLKEHRASVCTLSILRFRSQEYLASGADHGCSRILVWNPFNWQVIQKYDNHVAAVTAIVDLKDNCHFLSGGYDKRLNVFSLEQSKLAFSLPSNQALVAGAVANKSGSRVVTCGLDKSLNVWQVIRQGDRVQNLQLERKIQNNVLICSITASAVLDELVVIGTKDGKIKMINIEKGESYKTIQCTDANLIELILIERTSKQFYPFVLAWPYKDSKIHLVNTQNANITTKEWQGMLEFGCGIGPKSFLSQKGGKLICVSHGDSSKAVVSEFRVEELN